MRPYLAAVLVLASFDTAPADWKALAEESRSAKGGRQYEMKAAQFSASVLGVAMGKCVTEQPKRFYMYLKITESGSVAQSDSMPSSALAKCFEAQMTNASWPHPPFAPFVFEIEMFGEI
jgi:hypothetical protein